MKKEIAEQHAIGTYGIPTPVDQEHIGPTDSIAGAVAGMMDEIQASLLGDQPKGKTESPAERSDEKERLYREADSMRVHDDR